MESKGPGVFKQIATHQLGILAVSSDEKPAKSDDIFLFNLVNFVRMNCPFTGSFKRILFRPISNLKAQN